MLPSPQEFGKAATGLGIRNKDFIIVYGQGSMAMGPARAWWMFRMMGHNRICVLDGGLPAWQSRGYPVDTKPHVSGAAVSPFKTAYVPRLTVSLQQMKQAVGAGVLVCDARPAERFTGAQPEPRPGLRSGHIPGSCSIPAGILTDRSTGQLKSDLELKKILQKAGYTPNQAIYATCGSGVTACMITLALHKIGIHDTPVYDGAWAEWGMAESDCPVSISI